MVAKKILDHIKSNVWGFSEAPGAVLKQVIFCDSKYKCPAECRNGKPKLKKCPSATSETQATSVSEINGKFAKSSYNSLASN